MVYCSKCGLKNPDDAKYCGNCGAELNAVQKEWGEDWGKEFGEKMDKWGEDFGKRMEERGEECFGLPHGGAIIGIIIGAFIIIIGSSLALGLDFEVWGRWFGTGILIVIGLIIVIGAIYGLTRRIR